MRFRGRAVSARLAITVFVVGMATIVVPLAEAHTAHITSQHELGQIPDPAIGEGFAGLVSSTRGACERGRSITLYHKAFVGAPRDAVGTATTDSDGFWFELYSNPPAGSYYAVAAKKVVKRSGHKHICDAAKSNTLTVGDPADTDNDSDGFTPNQGDCNDSDSGINPAATEIQNEVDDNCDGQVDEGFEPPTATTARP